MSRTNFPYLPIAIFILLRLLAGSLPPSSAKVSDDAYVKATDALKIGDYGKVIVSLPEGADIRSLLLKGRAFQAADMQEAGNYFGQALAKDPHNIEATIGQGWALIRARKYWQAQSVLKDVVARFPKNAEALALFGRALYKSGQEEAGFKAMNMALAIDPQSFVVEDSVVSSYYDQAEFGKPEDLLAKFIAGSNNDPWPYLRRADLHAAMGKTDLAIKDCQQALVINPHCQLAHSHLASLLYTRGAYKEALAQTDVALEDRSVPEFVSMILRTRTKCEHQLGRTEDAVKDLNLYLKDVHQLKHLSNGTRNHLLERARDYEALKKYPQALADVQFVRSHFPKSTDAVVLSARLHEEMGQFSQSLNELDLLLAIDKTVPEWHKQRAEVLQKLGRQKEAEAELTTAKQLEARL